MEYFCFMSFLPGVPAFSWLKIGIENQWIILILGASCAIIFSILAEMMISKFNILKFCFWD